MATDVEIILKAIDQASSVFSTAQSKMTDSLDKIEKKQTAVAKSATTGFAAMNQTLLAAGAAYLSFGKVVESINLAARNEAVGNSFNFLADKINESGFRILQSLRKLSDGTAADVEIMQNANLALVNSFPADTIERLFMQARRAGQAFALSTDEAFGRLTLAISRQSAKILDDLGIIVNFGKINEQTALSLGKTTQELTQQELTAGAARQIIELLEKAYGGLILRSDSLSASSQRLSASLKNIQTDAGTFLGLVVRGSASFFTNLFDWGEMRRQSQLLGLEFDNLLDKWKGLQGVDINEVVRQVDQFGMSFEEAVRYVKEAQEATENLRDNLKVLMPPENLAVLERFKITAKEINEAFDDLSKKQITAGQDVFTGEQAQALNDFKDSLNGLGMGLEITGERFDKNTQNADLFNKAISDLAGEQNDLIAAIKADKLEDFFATSKAVAELEALGLSIDTIKGKVEAFANSTKMVMAGVSADLGVEVQKILDGYQKVNKGPIQFERDKVNKSNISDVDKAKYNAQLTLAAALELVAVGEKDAEKAAKESEAAVKRSASAFKQAYNDAQGFMDQIRQANFSSLDRMALKLAEVSQYLNPAEKAQAMVFIDTGRLDEQTKKIFENAQALEAYRDKMQAIIVKGLDPAAQTEFDYNQQIKQAQKDYDELTAKIGYSLENQLKLNEAIKALESQKNKTILDPFLDGLKKAQDLVGKAIEESAKKAEEAFKALLGQVGRVVNLLDNAKGFNELTVKDEKTGKERPLNEKEKSERLQGIGSSGLEQGAAATATALGADPGTASLIGNIIEATLGRNDKLTEGIGRIVLAINNSVDVVMGVFEPMLNLIGESFGSVAESLDAYFEIVSELAPVFQAAMKPIELQLKIMTGILEAIADLMGWAADAAGWIGDKIGDVGGAVAGIFKRHEGDDTNPYPQTDPNDPYNPKNKNKNNPNTATKKAATGAYLGDSYSSYFPELERGEVPLIAHQGEVVFNPFDVSRIKSAIPDLPLNSHSSSATTDAILSEIMGKRESEQSFKAPLSINYPDRSNKTSTAQAQGASFSININHYGGQMNDRELIRKIERLMRENRLSMMGV